MGATTRTELLVCLGIVVAVVATVAVLQDEPAVGAAVFLAGGAGAALTLGRPVAWLVPLVAAVLVAVIDRVGVEIETDFGDFMTILWLAVAAPGMVAGALLGAWLANRRAPASRRA